jgi:hypothetical protein
MPFDYVLTDENVESVLSSLHWQIQSIVHHQILRIMFGYFLSRIVEFKSTCHALAHNNNVRASILSVRLILIEKSMELILTSMLHCYECESIVQEAWLVIILQRKE